MSRLSGKAAVHGRMSDQVGDRTVWEKGNPISHYNIVSSLSTSARLIFRTFRQANA